MAFRLVFGAAAGADPGAVRLRVGLALDDELVGPVAEAIQSALAQHGFIKGGHPFFNPSVGRKDRRAASVPSDQQIIEVGGGLAQ